MKFRQMHIFLLTGALLAWPLTVSADDLFQKGVKAYNAKDYRTACSILEAFLQKTPDDVNALYYDALSRYQLGDSASAMQQYKRIIQVAPNSAAAGYAKAALVAMTASTTATTPSLPGPAKNPGRNEVAKPAPNLESANDEMKSLPDTANFYFTKESGGHMGVNVMINGHQVPAWFDTGAGAFFYRDQLVAAGVDCNRAVPAGNAQGWAGKAVPIFAMPAQVKLGTLTRTIMISMEETSTAIGKNLIGQSMIDGYQYEIDDKGGRVDLRKTIAATQQREDPLYDIPVKVVNSRDILTVEINGRNVEAFIDTGSTVTIISARVAEQLGIESTGTQRMTGVGGDLSVGVGTARIRLGPISKEFTVRIGGSGGTCIGQDFMEGWRFKIDREHERLRFFH